ncbi:MULTISPECIES: site-specific integrase [unclassified Caballeronia]|uniref:site-specific integrase n=1 Tax=unclassified Caballeronia TaxID=2646786 RepID=UPI002028AEDF|nr:MULTISPECIES: site-specific integrase [unclassified Caballeronia]
MTNDDVNQAMGAHLRRYGLPPLPGGEIDRDGRRVDLSGVTWRCNVATDHVALNWSRLEVGNVILSYALRRWAIVLLTQRSGATVYQSVETTVSVLTGKPEKGREVISSRQASLWIGLVGIHDPQHLRPALCEVVKSAVQALRQSKRLDSFYVIRHWYAWCAEMLTCLGFDKAAAEELDEIRIPVRPSRLAVELEDDNCGPLWDVEVTLLRRALTDDTSMHRVHVMQRAATALCLAYGRNPANFALLREADLRNSLAGFTVPAQWVLAIPRIKKRGLGARQAFVEEPVSEELLTFLQQLLEINKAIDCGSYPRPLFMRRRVDAWRQDTDMGEFGYHIRSDQFAKLVKDFGRRMRLVSPRTLNSIHITPRRLRYTFATTMVELGVSRGTLATLLDHSDTQHVHVYYALKGRRMTRILDRAAALKLGPLMDLFKGKIIPSNDQAINGERPDKRVAFAGDVTAIAPVEVGTCGKSGLCALDPPFSCYVCPKFQPYRQADHRAVLDALLIGREQRMQQLGTRVAVQLDEVIYAVAQVVDTVEGKVDGAGTNA